MTLPSPIPDNPMRWDGWRNYNSDNYYERLCLSFDSNPSDHQIEDHCRQLLVWWQKKLPLKNQPSNPVAQLLRAGLDEATQYLVEARTELLNPQARAQLDEFLRGKMKADALAEFTKYFSFSVADGVLSKEDEANLFHIGSASGLHETEMLELIETELEKRGAKRKVEQAPPPPPPPEPAAASSAPVAISDRSQDPFTEFKRMLRLSGLDGDLTDDQRDALCNMGENLGLTGGQAEDLIDEYIDEVADMPLLPVAPQQRGVAVPGRPVLNRSAPPPKRPEPPKKVVTPVKKEANSQKIAQQISGKDITTVISPLNRAQEKLKNPNFLNTLGMEMLLVPSGGFNFGSEARDAAPNERPVSQVTQSCFYMAKFPVTNWQYEKFDPAHSAKRGPWADDKHPVIYVSSIDAINFCQWLSAREKRKYRLPTEAEWEYAARGADGRNYPWGQQLDRGDVANFADVNTNFAWKDSSINDGYAETSPVGAYPRGISPFGIEDMAGTVWEWCLDFFEAYKDKPRTNPQGPTTGWKRIYRGGSWKSRAGSLRASARNFNMPDYSSNDVGFRIVCECA